MPTLIEAICQSDPSAWCFIPRDHDEAGFCSERFSREWNLMPLVPGTLRTQVTVKSIAYALDAAGIPAVGFFARISATVMDFPDKLTVLRSDGLRANVTIQCVFDRSEGAILGHLVRFAILTDNNLMESVLDQIAVARKKLRVLSKREMEILNLVYEGRTNKAISIAMKISEKTVEKHRARMVMKLGLNSTALLVRTITIARMLPMPIKEPGDAALDARLAEAVQQTLK